MNTAPILSVKNLSIAFPDRGSLNYCVQDLSYDVQVGEVVGIVGESGCGKSLSSLAVMGILPAQAKILQGEINFHGRNLLAMSKDEHRKARVKDLAMIFQNPMSSLNPYLKIGKQLSETLTLTGECSERDALKCAKEMLEKVYIPEAASRLNQYPHEMSGGMCQRVMIAMALMHKPKLLIADEPTTALDVTVQAEILALLSELMEKDSMGYRMSMILISHDIGVIANMADRTMVMYAGSMMETSDSQDLLSNPKHPYTEALLSSIPDLESPIANLDPIPGQPPLTNRPHQDCPFHERCNYVKENCKASFPKVDDQDQHQYRCFHPVDQRKPVASEHKLRTLVL